jgi:hypothetical protein
MTTQKCYFASFNVGNIEVWKTDFYLKKQSVFEEIVDTIDKIVEQIGCFDANHSENEIKHAISEFQKSGYYKELDLDFFILESMIWENYEQKINIENGIDKFN